MATIKDVARLAGVSISTVSRVINNSKPVSSEVKQRVIEAIDELGYIPNEVARSLVTKKSNLIGVVVTDIGHSYISQMVRGIEEIGRMYDYDILLSSSYNDLETELKFAQILKNKQVEGIIVIAEDYNPETIDFLKAFGRPFVYLNRYNKSEDVFTVSLDSNLAVFSMMEFLKNQGHKRVVYVSPVEADKNSIELEKIGSFEDFNKKNSRDSYVLKIAGYRFKDGYEAGPEIISKVRELKASAIFCAYDEIAIGLLNYCYDNDIKVPEEISVAGYGRIKLGSYYRPRLTTVVEPYYDIGAVAIRKIIKDIREEENIEKTTYLPEKIFVGDSVRDIKKV